MLEKGKPSEKVGRKVADLSLVLGDKVAELPGTKKIQPVILPETKQLMLEKGKPSEKVGRKVTDLSLLGDKVAELPGKSKDTSCNPAKNKPTDA